MAKIKKPTVKVILRKDKILASGKYPVMLRVTFNRKPKYYVLKGENGTLSAEPNKWNKEIGRYNRDKNSNQFLDQYELKANEVLRELEFSDFSFKNFEDRYFKKYESESITSFIDHLIEKLKNESRLSSASSYRDTRNRLREFKTKISFRDINLRFLEDFERHLLDKGNSINSIGIYMRTLRAIYNKAVSEDLIKEDNYPFKKYRIKTGNPSKRALSKEDIIKLMNSKQKKNSRKWHSLNYFIFSYLTRGMNFKDMVLLKWKENILGDRIVYIRAKTANSKKTLDPNIIKIEPEIQKILNRYSQKSVYVFPVLEPGLPATTIRHRIKNRLKRISKDISAIATELEIKDADKITFYWARHTYATTLKRSGISISVISEALGHSSETTTKAYLDKFEQTEIDNTFKHLI
jgi:site-specific recombinase XerD